jgi:hypothetical protein
VPTTVDQLQLELCETVFHYAADRKKAAGRALGTIIEIITYYKLCSWGFSKNTLIEKRIPEFGRPDITHNVEFSIHRAKNDVELVIPRLGKTINARAIGIAADIDIKETRLAGTLLDSTHLLRNSAHIGEREGHLLVANLIDFNAKELNVSLVDLEPEPIAIFECKRVGVEEGMKKGPQSIEKAKQGAYVARSVSALQKVIDGDGKRLGFLPVPGGKPLISDYGEMLAGIVHGKLPMPKGFMLTVGVTSNHGNWFTAENMNKELKVLAAAYDWLLFLTDEGLMEFVHQCVMEPTEEYAAVKTAFRKSYDGTKGGNRFTKTKIDLDADNALRRYFAKNAKASDKWFNIIEPAGEELTTLAGELQALLRRRGVE